MMRECIEDEVIDVKISNCIKQFENVKEEQLTELIIEILVESIIKEYYEESNQIFEI